MSFREPQSEKSSTAQVDLQLSLDFGVSGSNFDVTSKGDCTMISKEFSENLFKPMFVTQGSTARELMYMMHYQ